MLDSGSSENRSCARSLWRCAPWSLPVRLLAESHKIEEIKNFLLTVREKEAESTKIKKNEDRLKLKLKQQITYTWVAGDLEMAEKLRQMLPLGLPIKELK
ncbi:60S ribosomal protein L38-like [Talpa occidentalis]|uniref:60S ribosomal protein L38-like n=1 Tax=Talpa occidentalis TaxID=50954 RepID=UPI001890360D|nr:60S ribosomal protein L38-like [Talpa occidentalis]